MHKGNERAAHKWKKEIVDGGETALGTPQKKHFAFSVKFNCHSEVTV